VLRLAHDHDIAQVVRRQHHRPQGLAPRVRRPARPDDPVGEVDELTGVRRDARLAQLGDRQQLARRRRTDPAVPVEPPGLVGQPEGRGGGHADAGLHRPGAAGVVSQRRREPRRGVRGAADAESGQQRVRAGCGARVARHGEVEAEGAQAARVAGRLECSGAVGQSVPPALHDGRRAGEDELGLCVRELTTPGGA
jgi:hypothetical protein